MLVADRFGRRRPIAWNMKEKTTRSAGAPVAAVESARRFAAQAEAAIADLEKRVPTGMGQLERALAERVRAALERLLACSGQLAEDGLMVIGSTGQRRPHQLLKTEQELRHEITDSLEKLTFRAEQGAIFARAQAATRRQRSKPGEQTAQAGGNRKGRS
jgi:hypothetical protein